MDARTNLALGLPQAISMPTLKTKTQRVWPDHSRYSLDPEQPTQPIHSQVPEYPDLDYLPKDGQRACFEESDWTISVQGRPTMDEDQIHESIEDAVVDEIGSSHCNSLLKRAAGSCGQDSAYDIEDKIQHVQALEEAEDSTLPSYPDPPQLSQMSRESKRHTKGRDILEQSYFVAAKERLRERTIELQLFPQQRQEEEGEDGIQAIGSEKKGTDKYRQQTEESFQQQGLCDESTSATLISQGSHHSAGPCYEDGEGHMDYEARIPNVHVNESEAACSLTQLKRPLVGNAALPLLLGVLQLRGIHYLIPNLLLAQTSKNILFRALLSA